MKKIFCMALLPVSLFLVSCGGDGDSRHDVNSDTPMVATTDDSKMTTEADKAADTGNAAMNQNSNATGTPVTDKMTTEFVQKALSGGMMEVEMGNMAANQGASERVKSYGTMLVTDHTTAGNELKSMAASNSIPAPAAMMPDHKSHMDMLMNKKGGSFDKAYMDMMIKDHKKDIADYKKAAADLPEASYKSFASKTLPVLQKHLDSAMAIQKAL